MRVVKMDIPVLFLILRETLLVLSIEYDVGCGFVICGLYYVEVRSLYSHSAGNFYYKWMLDFLKCFFCIYWYNYVIFTFHFVYVMCHIYWYADIAPTLHLWNKSDLIIMYDLFNVLLDQFANIFSNILACMFIEGISLWFSFFVVFLSGFEIRIMQA